MTYNIIQDIVEWNTTRGNTEFKGDLEYNMLHEELNEYMYAYPKTLTDKFGVLEEEEFVGKEDEIIEYLNTKEFLEDWRTNQLDALGDLIFVAIGSMSKILDGDYVAVEEVLMSIIAANNTKSATKNEEGKITKPKDFVGPESIIKSIYKGVKDGQSS